MRKCDFCDKTELITPITKSRVFKAMLCPRHYLQFKVHGKIQKTKYDPNVYYFENDIVRIEIFRKNKVYFAIIDKEHYEKVKDHRWYYDGCYPRTHLNTNNKAVTLHIFLFGREEGKYLDHISGNRLDNRKLNLRFVTPKQSNMNKATSPDSNSGYTGVSWDKLRNRWRVRIHENEKDRHLGYFLNKEDAIKARKDAEEKYFGEYARKSNILDVM